jgi:hypothetical protein
MTWGLVPPSQKRLEAKSASQVGTKNEPSATFAARSMVGLMAKSPIGVTKVSEITFAPVVETRNCGQGDGLHRTRPAA